MMRLLLLSLVAVAVAPAVAAPQRAEPVVVHGDRPALRFIDPPSGERVLSTVPTIDPDTGKAVKCRNADAQFAGRDGLAPIKPLQPQKLTELPPATPYMAVYRHIGGCNAPLTMVEYRNPRRR
jgi:hypothetical protein